MMEVGSPSLQSVSRGRHIEQARPPSVDTGLSLGLPASNNKGAPMSPQGTGLLPPMSVPLSNTAGGYITTSSGRDEGPPISSFGQDTRIETLTTSPLGIVHGNKITSTSPPDNGPPPSIPTAAYWTTPTMPQNPLSKPTSSNVGSVEEFDKAVSSDAGSENILIAHMAAPLHTEAMRVEVDDRQLDMATQPSYLEESQTSQTDFNNMYSGDETQLVHDSQVLEANDTQPAITGDETQLVHDSQVLEANDTQPAITGETQLVNGDEHFDDMEVLQNNTFTASAPPLTNTGPSVLHEPLQGTDARPLQDSFNGPASQLINGIPASYLTNVSAGERETHATAEGINGRVSSTIVPTSNKHPEVHPVETAEQLDITEGKEGKDTITSEPRPGLLDENIEGKSNADGLKSADGVAEIDLKDDVNENAKIVSEQDIQEIKGRKVVKKFGRKKFKGEVVDYDAENQWFKVVYEDGDDEDLNLLEVKEILLNADVSSNASTAKRKRSQPEGAVNNQQARKQKATPKKKGSAAKKRAQQVKSPPGSKTKGVKRKAKSKSPAASAHDASPVHSQPTSGAKRKRSSHTKLELENVGEKEIRKETGQSSGAKTPRKSAAKRGSGKKALAKKDPAMKKGGRHRSFPKLPVVASEVKPAVRAGEGDKVGKGKGKRRKIDASKDHDTLVGKSVKKAFGGTLYGGVVTKFDKKTEYYKVQYEDGDQEDLELEELKAVLVR